MEIINVLVAAFAGFAAGAVWYMVLAEQWMDAAAIPRGPDGKPEGGQSAGMLIFGLVCQIFVAGMMRHMFELSGIDTLAKGLVSGAGVGAFFITPWIALNNSYGGRPLRLTLIDGGYATVACAIIGAVLTLF
ncbi:DUF1761 domain-containing protein [Cognatishimia sp. F0-27]|uniref:DUF1761 domain-containing protein n=1 Tax=Cognatishimia sp. F0-27 TaxID=2816855 RepID=UPI001D0CBD1B|nr:DUF1761 domain-containing protein [Cognatishimia sp. F0-27]MCC1491203.1 DUF1761 domain-containing protein [Cognatishimia sp. F0-27]